MSNKFIVSPSPHVFGKDTTSKLMRDVLIALLPAFVVTVVIYGMQALVLTGVAVVSCVLFEYLIQKFLLKGSNTINDYSAILTGVLLAFNLPIGIPIWMVVLGSLVSIGIAKMSFGGLGRNPFNPALVGRVFLLLSFPVQMTMFDAPDMVRDALYGATDAMSGATPLAYVKDALKNGCSVSEIMPNISYQNMLLGIKSGSFGEIGALALILGFVYLLVRKVITWHIPLFIVGSMTLFTGALWFFNPEQYMDPIFHILTGGVLLGAIFMATDYVTSPMSKRGMMIYGVGIGVITILIRVWGAYPEGISFAILIMNAVVPILNKYVKPARFGVSK